MNGASRWLEAWTGTVAASVKAAVPTSKNPFNSAKRGARIVCLINPPSDSLGIKRIRPESTTGVARRRMHAAEKKHAQQALTHAGTSLYPAPISSRYIRAVRSNVEGVWSYRGDGAGRQ